MYYYKLCLTVLDFSESSLLGHLAEVIVFAGHTIRQARRFHAC